MMIAKEVNDKTAIDLIVLTLSKARDLIPGGMVAELEFQCSVLRAELHAEEQLATRFSRSKDVILRLKGNCAAHA